MNGNAPPFCVRNCRFCLRLNLGLVNLAMFFLCFFNALTCFFLSEISPRSTFNVALQMVLINLSGARETMLAFTLGSWQSAKNLNAWLIIFDFPISLTCLDSPNCSTLYTLGEIIQNFAPGHLFVEHIFKCYRS